ncbi:MAK10-like protein [Tanacetum coccineum]
MGDANPIHTLGDYSKPCHEGYRNTIELPVGNNMVPLRSDTIRLVQNGCSFHGLRSEDPNQHLKDFLKLVDSLDLDGENRERTRPRLFQFSLRDQASNWLERLPTGSITTWEDLTTRFLSQFFPPERTAKLRNDIMMFQQHQGESLSKAWTRFKDLLQKVSYHGIDLWLQVQIFYDHVTPVTRQTIDQSTSGKLRDRNAEESSALLEDLTLYDNESWNDTKDFAKSIKAISLPQDVLSTSDRRLIELKNQVQCLMEAHLAPMQPTQVNKITTSCEICSGPYDTQYCMEDLEQTLVEYVSSCTNEAGGKWYTFKPEQNNFGDTYNLSWKRHPNLSKTEEEEREREGDPEDTNTITYNEEQRDTPQLERKDINVVDNLGPNRDGEGIEWLDVEEPLDLVDTSKELVYESLIKEMPKCSLNYDYKIKKGDPRNLKIPCMIGHKFTANAYINVDLPMNIMSLAYYNSIRKNGYEYRGRNFVGLGRDMHVFIGNMSYVIDFTIWENIKTNIDPSLSHITFKSPYKDPNRSELSSEGHELLSSRVILSEDDYDRGCRKPSDLEDGFYRDTIKLGPEYVTGMDDEGEVT